MMGKYGLRCALLSAVLILVATCACADGPVVNRSFELGTAGWNKYTYFAPPAGDPGEPMAGAIGPSGTFYVLAPDTVPDGSSVCGSQCDQGIASNGGVSQTVYWTGGAATLFVTARAYSEWPDEMGGGPYPDGCGVRMGVVPSFTTNRADVTSWVWFPWGTGWNTRSINIPGNGTYTLFIESYQPYRSLNVSTLWDNVVWTAYPPIQLVGDGPHSEIPGDVAHPDTTALITWTTDVPSTSKVEYGLTPTYNHTTENTALVTDHSVLLTGLSHTSTYHFRASSSASGYSTWASDDCTFQTPIQFSEITTSVSPDGLSTVFIWRTDVPTTSQVEYGETSLYGNLTSEDTNLVQQHSVSISGLLADHTYHFRVWGRNQPDYSDAYSGDQTFTTLPYPTSSLQNGSFELGHGGQTPSFYPWVQYTSIDGYGHFYTPIDGIVGSYPKSGSLSWYQGIKAEDGSYFMGAGGQRKTKNGGVLQRILVTPGDIYAFGAHYATYRQGGTDRDLRVRLGLDTDGGVDPTNENVKWWSTFSSTNDSQWHWATLTAQAGSGGVVTVFLDIQQLYGNNWMVAAIDDAKFGQPSVMTIGQLKQAADPLGVVLHNTIVTYVASQAVTYNGTSYTKAYLQETNRSSGIAALFPRDAPERPEISNLVDLTGSLVLNGMEATVVAFNWTCDRDPRDLPKPVGISQLNLGGWARNQPQVVQNAGPSNIGLRVRVFGKVTAIDYENRLFTKAVAYIDDGSHLLDHTPVPPELPVYGIRVQLIDNGSRYVRTGDYLAVTGILTVPLIDPDGWSNTGDEFYAHCVVTRIPDDWNILHAP